MLFFFSFDISWSETVLQRLSAGRWMSRQLKMISSESAGESLRCELLSDSPRAGLVARSGEMGTCHSVQVEGEAFSATQSCPDPTRTARSWDRAFEQLYVGLWAVGDG